MWDDAMQMQGRHTKRKWKRAAALLILAALAAAGAWLSVHPEVPGAWKSALARWMDRSPCNLWVPGEETPETAFLLEGQVYTLKKDRLQVWDLSGEAGESWTVELEEPRVVQSEHSAILYEGQGQELYLAGRELTQISIPGGIAGAAVSDLGEVSVITQGSGCMTKTERFDKSGRKVGELSLTDQAMVLMTYLRGSSTLAACCVTTQGDWVLRFDGGDNTMVEKALDVGLVYEIRPWSGGVVLWTDRGLAAYTGDGTCVQEIKLEARDLLCWDSGSFCAAAVRRGTEVLLLTVTETGVKEIALTGAPRELSVCGSGLALLDSQALLLYDKSGALLREEAQGVLAQAVQAVDGGAILFGETGFFRALTK